jgi:exopolyphosphatase/guanosine-5'-triphosphate,3'-diphosphate pyrophosphatase|tara:strand:+ start:608 stop:1513 length:906 start_codon:yes stop_codon:yes gene_type:complete
MESGLRFAAIDIGSNAMRLLFTRVIEKKNGKPFFIKESLIRMPLRLGHDAFTSGVISKKNCESFLYTILGFKNLIEAYGPVSYRACATAAMRNAKNGLDLVQRVKESSGIDLDIITGQEEAAMILSRNINQYLKTKKSYIHIDVGGGSTELTIISDGEKQTSKSFSIGSVRLLEGKVQKSYWNVMHDWINDSTRSLGQIKAIGSGGNINKIASMLGKYKGESVSRTAIKKTIKKINTKDMQDRITVLGLRPDRADVIIHASKIYLNCMKWAGAKKIIVPQSGLADGMVSQLYDHYKSNNIG